MDGGNGMYWTNRKHTRIQDCMTNERWFEYVRFDESKDRRQYHMNIT